MAKKEVEKNKQNFAIPPENYKLIAIGFAIILLSKGVSLIISDLLNAGNTPPAPTETETIYFYNL